MSLGVKVKQLRENKDWTQGQLATYSGVERSYISLIEIDNIKNPSAKKLIALARALSVDDNVLFQAAGIKIDDKLADRVYLLPENLNPEDRKKVERYAESISQQRELEAELLDNDKTLANKRQNENNKTQNRREKRPLDMTPKEVDELSDWLLENKVKNMPPALRKIIEVALEEEIEHST